MARNYYYLVAGLPDLFMEDTKAAPSVKSFLADLKEEIEPEDFDLISAMVGHIDNRNLISILESKDDFDDRGRFSREELSEAVMSPEVLPSYMREYLDAHKEGRQIYPGLTAIDQLTWLFYDEMSRSKNEFQRDWFAFDADLRNAVAAVNIRKGLDHIESLATERDRPGAFTIVGDGDVAEAVLRSTTPDFGLSSAYPWIDKVVALSKAGLSEMEKALDELRWDMLDELTTVTYFQSETVAAFTQKLLIVERWMKLQPEVGREKLDKLIGELMESFVMPEGF